MDLWHYINGQCLYNGLDIKELEVSDMLDVLHYLFETDAVIHSKEHFDSRNSIRDYLYKSLYDRPYSFSSSGSTKEFKSEEDYNMDPFDENGNFIPQQTSNVTKPFIPATDFDPNSEDPFAGVLRERPLG